MFSRTRKRKTTQPGGLFFGYGSRLCRCHRGMRPTSVARWVTSPTAAGGGRKEGAVSAAVGKCLAHFAARRHCRAPQTGRYAEPFFVNVRHKDNKTSPADPTIKSTENNLFSVLFLCFKFFGWFALGLEMMSKRRLLICNFSVVGHKGRTANAV